MVLRGPVTGESVGKLMKQISTMSRNLSKSDVIYLVLDTPGGSVMDGIDFIDFVEAIPQEVKTITLFAASMGFQIVQSNPGKRLIARGGTLMSHRAYLGGFEGQLDGEFETRYRMIKRKTDYLDVVASHRMGLTLDQYRAKIKDELWVHGFDAQAEKVADEMVLLRCGESVVGTDSIIFKTMFGDVRVVFDKCPLIREPVAVELVRVRLDAQRYVGEMFHQAFYDKVKFVKEVVLTDKFNKLFP